MRKEDDVAVNVTTGPLAELQQALKEAAEDNEKSQQDSEGESVTTKKIPLTWAQHQRVDPNWYFDTTTERFKDLSKERAPPPGAYMPKWSKVFPRCLSSEWQLRKHRSRKHLLSKYDLENEGPAELPNLAVREHRVKKIVDWSKQSKGNTNFSGLPSAQAYKLTVDYTEPDKLLG